MFHNNSPFNTIKLGVIFKPIAITHKATWPIQVTGEGPAEKQAHTITLVLTRRKRQGILISMCLSFSAIWDVDMIFVKDFLIRDAFAFKSFTLITEKITRAFYGCFLCSNI